MSNENEEVEVENTALVTALIEELTENPKLAVSLVHTLSKITKPWEPLGNRGDPINEIPVPPGQSPKSFKQQTSSAYISGYRLTTIFGNNVAMITKDTPKWKVVIEGVNQVDAPFVQHANKAESNAKEFAEAKLKELGYIIG